MKKITLISMALLFTLVSCGPSLTDTQLVKVQKKLEKSKWKVSVVGVKDGLKGKIILEKDLKLNEKDNAGLLQMKMLSNGKADVEFSKIAGKVEYVASNDLFSLKRGDSQTYYNSREDLDKAEAQTVEREARVRYCDRKKRTMFGSFCEVYKRKNKKNYKEIKDKIAVEFSKAKKIEKGKILLSKNVRIEAMTISMDNITKEEVRLFKL